MTCSACGSQNCACDKGGQCACGTNCSVCAAKGDKSKKPKTAVPSDSGSGHPRG